MVTFISRFAALLYNYRSTSTAAAYSSNCLITNGLTRPISSLSRLHASINPFCTTVSFYCLYPTVPVADRMSVSIQRLRGFISSTSRSSWLRHPRFQDQRGRHTTSAAQQQRNRDAESETSRQTRSQTGSSSRSQSHKQNQRRTNKKTTTTSGVTGRLRPPFSVRLFIPIIGRDASSC